jgi:hypothetical protein
VKKSKRTDFPGSGKKKPERKDNSISSSHRELDRKAAGLGGDRDNLRSYRNNVLSYVAALRAVITGAAKELRLVAGERVFELPISRLFELKAQSLDSLGRELKRLEDLVAVTAGYQGQR